MGKVGFVAGGMPQMESTSIAKQFAHFTSTFTKTYTFTAKCSGVIGLSVNSQYYSRNPNGVEIIIYRNRKMIGYASAGASYAPGASAYSPKEIGDKFEVVVNVRASGADVGIDYWVSAIANEPIEFVET